MKHILPLAILLFAPSLSAHAAPAPRQAKQCSLDSMSPAEKQALEAGYYRLERSEGKAQAEAWVREQAAAYGRKLVAEGVCPGPQTANTPDAAPSRETPSGDKLLNRHGKPCRRIELENQNVPNIGGSMGWALIPVCKD